MCIVAIDGPSASGKSTVSRAVAQSLGFIYADSGSFYRGMTWKVIREGADPEDAERVREIMHESAWDLFLEEHVVRFSIDGEDPGMQIRSEPVRENVSYVARMPDVRDFMNSRFRELVQFGNLVMEGRDIGSVVFPEATFKFYIDASPEERARRRLKDIEDLEGQGDERIVLESLKRRDTLDSSRPTAPLQIPLGARVIDTTNMSRQEVIDCIVRDIRREGYGA